MVAGTLLITGDNSKLLRNTLLELEFIVEKNSEIKGRVENRLKSMNTTMKSSRRKQSTSSRTFL